MTRAMKKKRGNHLMEMRALSFSKQQKLSKSHRQRERKKMKQIKHKPKIRKNEMII